MDSAIRIHGFAVLAVLVGAAGLAAAFWRSKKASSTPGLKRSPIDYLLLWPLLFSNDPTGDGANKKNIGVSTRIVVGWIIVFLLIVATMLFDW
jgi:hypothetical protein